MKTLSKILMMGAIGLGALASGIGAAYINDQYRYPRSTKVEVADSSLLMLTGKPSSTPSFTPSKPTNTPTPSRTISPTITHTSAPVRDRAYDYTLASQNLEERVIPNADYPDGRCSIWVPSNNARSQYLQRTIFQTSPIANVAGIALATPGGVDMDLTRFGYPTAKNPPSMVPKINYPVDDMPIYPFAGQMVPGTNIKYVTPTIDPVWLVDVVKIDGKDVVVPALSTIDFLEFKSINWPRERYMEAIVRARNGSGCEIISGHIRNHPSFHNGTLNLDGPVSVRGDLFVDMSEVLRVRKGSIFVLSANSNNQPLFGGYHDIDILLGGDYISEGTRNNPVIFTSDATNPRGNDWRMFQTYDLNPLSKYEADNTIIEYAGTGAWTTHNIQQHIIRYTEYIAAADDVGRGIVMLRPNLSVSFSELHNNVIDIICGRNGYVHNNQIFFNLDLQTGHWGKGLHAFMNDFIARDNIIVRKQGAGMEPEEGTTKNTLITNNTIALNHGGLVMYYKPGFFSDPEISENNVWGNLCGMCANQNITFNYARGPNSEVTHEYDNLNSSANPLFLNITIFDLKQLK